MVAQHQIEMSGQSHTQAPCVESASSNALDRRLVESQSQFWCMVKTHPVLTESRQISLVLELIPYWLNQVAHHQLIDCTALCYLTRNSEQKQNTHSTLLRLLVLHSSYVYYYYYYLLISVTFKCRLNLSDVTSKYHSITMLVIATLLTVFNIQVQIF